MPIATDTLADPKTFPTTVGMQEKNPPLEAPLIMTKAINGPNELEMGHNTSILAALRMRDMNSVLSGPIASHRKPHTRRPTAEEKLNPATSPAPTLDDKPREEL
jgi:hypothetical protein